MNHIDALNMRTHAEVIRVPLFLIKRFFDNHSAITHLVRRGGEIEGKEQPKWSKVMIIFKEIGGIIMWERENWRLQNTLSRTCTRPLSSSLVSKR